MSNTSEIQYIYKIIVMEKKTNLLKDYRVYEANVLGMFHKVSSVATLVMPQQKLLSWQS